MTVTELSTNYEGPPCIKCGNTLRYQKRGTCVMCNRARAKIPSANKQRKIYNATPKARAAKNEYMKKYKASSAGMAVRKVYEKTEGFIAARKIRDAVPERVALKNKRMLAYSKRPEVMARAKARAHTLEGKLSQMLHGVKKRSMQRGIEFNIRPDAVRARLMTGKCERTGIAFHFGAPLQGCRVHPWAPSIDRIDNSRGYVTGNVQVVCNVFNIAKSDFPEHVIYTFARALLNQKVQELQK